MLITLEQTFGNFLRLKMVSQMKNKLQFCKRKKCWKLLNQKRLEKRHHRLVDNFSFTKKRSSWRQLLNQKEIEKSCFSQKRCAMETMKPPFDSEFRNQILKWQYSIPQIEKKIKIKNGIKIKQDGRLASATFSEISFHKDAFENQESDFFTKVIVFLRSAFWGKRNFGKKLRFF